MLVKRGLGRGQGVARSREKEHQARDGNGPTAFVLGGLESAGAFSIHNTTFYPSTVYTRATDDKPDARRDRSQPQKHEHVKSHYGRKGAILMPAFATDAGFWLYL